MRFIFRTVLAVCTCVSVISASFGDETNRYVGLWIGSASLTAVGEARSATPDVPTPTRTPFDMRLIMFVAPDGSAYLLNEVTVMKKPAVSVKDSNGVDRVVEPSRTVLVTDPSKLAQFAGITERDGSPMGWRISSTCFDFPNAQYLPLTGTFGPTGTLSGTIVLPADYAGNPFKHKYHPDHDNKDATFQAFRAEAYDVTRRLNFVFSPTNLVGATPAGYGVSDLGGVYGEDVTGLHRTNLVTRGTFSLRRMDFAAEVNQ